MKIKSVTHAKVGRECLCTVEIEVAKKETMSGAPWEPCIEARKKAALGGRPGPSEGQPTNATLS
jgi:hypothetical protein